MQQTSAASQNLGVNVWAVVPAAGVGRRMGTPKQLLPYQGSTMAATVVRTLLQSGVKGVVVVTRSEYRSALQLPVDPRVEIAFNDDSHSEMIDSIRIGLAVLIGKVKRTITMTGSMSQTAPGGTPSAVGSDDQPPHEPNDGVLVVPADMPQLSVETCRRCADAYVVRPGRIVVAAHRGRQGHPLVFPLRVWSTVNILQSGLNGLLESHPESVYELEIDDPCVLKDVDTKGDYRGLGR